MDRRSFLSGLAATSAIGGSATALEDKICYRAIHECPAGHRLPTPLEMEFHLLKMRGPVALDSWREENEIAKAVLDSSPTNLNPVEVAQYFKDIHDGKIKDEWKYYAREWVYYANPVILAFFSAASRTPRQGDETKWCAAFVSWIIERSRKDRQDPADTVLTKPVGTAWAKDYRKFGDETQKPKRGDIVVFSAIRRERNRITKSGGHVGFFVSETADTVDVLGGNQAERQVFIREEDRAIVPKGYLAQDGETKGGGRVGIDTYPKDGKTPEGTEYRLLSYQTAPELHDRPPQTE